MFLLYIKEHTDLGVISFFCCSDQALLIVWRVISSGCSVIVVSTATISFFINFKYCHKRDKSSNCKQNPGYKTKKGKIYVPGLCCLFKDLLSYQALFTLVRLYLKLLEWKKWCVWVDMYMCALSCNGLNLGHERIRCTCLLSTPEQNTQPTVMGKCLYQTAPTAFIQRTVLPRCSLVYLKCINHVACPNKFIVSAARSQ